MKLRYRWLADGVPQQLPPGWHPQFLAELDHPNPGRSAQIHATDPHRHIHHWLRGLEWSAIGQAADHPNIGHRSIQRNLHRGFIRDVIGRNENDVGIAGQFYLFKHWYRIKTWIHIHDNHVKLVCFSHHFKRPPNMADYLFVNAWDNAKIRLDIWEPPLLPRKLRTIRPWPHAGFRTVGILFSYFCHSAAEGAFLFTKQILGHPAGKQHCRRSRVGRKLLQPVIH
jgi:hypothetical protein